MQTNVSARSAVLYGRADTHLRATVAHYHRHHQSICGHRPDAPIPLAHAQFIGTKNSDQTTPVVNRDNLVGIAHPDPVEPGKR